MVKCQGFKVAHMRGLVEWEVFDTAKIAVQDRGNVEMTLQVGGRPPCLACMGAEYLTKNPHFQDLMEAPDSVRIS